MEKLLELLGDVTDEAKKELEDALLSRYEQGKRDQIHAQEKESFDELVKGELTKCGALDIDIARSVMDMENVIYEKGEVLGLSEEIGRIKEKYGFLFQQEGPHFSAGSGQAEERDISKLNYLERLKLYRENPELYRIQNSK